MTGRWGAEQVDDQGLTVGASSQPDPVHRRLAVRAVAALSEGAGDCAHLLELLGLEAAEGLAELAKETK